MDTRKNEPAKEGPAPRARPRLREHLAAVAKEKPQGGRARAIVYLVVGGAALIAMVLQMLGVTKSPVAEHMEQHLRDQGRVPGAAPAKPSGSAPGEASPAPGAGEGKPR